jgi:phosphatidylglycerophosphatase A
MDRRLVRVVKKTIDELTRTKTKLNLALALATCGVGYFPIAPGTWGSLVGVGLFFVLHRLFLKLLLFTRGSEQSGFHPSQKYSYTVIGAELVTAVVLVAIGTWAASRTEKLSGKKDPGKVVIDEVAGQFIALMIAAVLTQAWWMFLSTFVLFRMFDIVKPYPAGRLESLKGGLGIMADDVIAGLYAGDIVALVIIVKRLF